MRTTIDRAGRVVIPKALRDEAGLEAGTELEIELRDGRIEIEPSTMPMRLAAASGGAVIQSAREMPPLGVSDVRDTLEHLRR